MPIVMEGNCITVIVMDSRGCNNGAAKVTPDILNHCPRITEIWFGINVESMLMVRVIFGLDFFERKSNDSFHFIYECSA